MMERPSDADSLFLYQLRGQNRARTKSANR
jgi:hypothetical protein